MSQQIFFSVITLAYCGSTHLGKVYENMKSISKTYPDFEWIIVDDFSPDEGKTVSEIERIKSDNILNIKSILLEKNFYGSRSTYLASTIASGSYAIILDQDDLLNEDALHIFAKYISKYDSKNDFAGVCGRCINSEGSLIGKKLPANEFYSTEPDIRHRLKIRGEMFQCTKIELIKFYFKELHPGNTNGLVWNRISQKYKYVYTNEIVRKYNTSNPGSVSNIRKIRYVATVAAQYVEYLDTIIHYFTIDPIYIFKISIHTRRFSMHSKKQCQIAIVSNNFSVKLLLTLVYPFSLFLYYRDLKKMTVKCN